MSRATLIGTYCGGSASQQLSEMQTYLNVDHLPIGMAYFDVSQSWSAGMWSTFYPAVIATAYDGIIAVPMLIGPQPITHLSAGLTSGVAVTSLPVNAIPATGGITSGTLIPSGTIIAVLAGNTPNYFTASANVSVGATSIPVTSQAPTTTYASGAGVKAQMTVSPQAATDTTGAGNTPTIMTMAAIAAGTWDSHFTKCFQAAADRPNAILRIGWELYGNAWYAWNGEGCATQHKNAYMRLVDLARAVSSTFRFAWDGGAQLFGYNPMTEGAYPGDAYCDYISADVYDDTSPWGSSGWDTEIAARFQTGLDFADAHGKQYIIPEFGFWPTGSGGGGDDKAWINRAFAWIEAEPNLYAALFFDSPVGKFSATGSYPTAGPVAASLITTYANQNFSDLANPPTTGSAIRFTIVGGARHRLVPSTPSPPPMPTYVPAGLKRQFAQDFNTPVAVGSFSTVYGPSGTDPNKFGLTYDGNTSTNGTTVYSSAKCCSVSGGSLFVNCHSEGSTTYAAAPYPWWSGARGDFQNGQWGGCVRLADYVNSTTSPGKNAYKIAFLLWPSTGLWTNEVDFPEVDPDMTANIRAVALSDPAQRGGAHNFSGNFTTGTLLTDGKYHTWLVDWPAPISVTFATNDVVTFATPHNFILNDTVEFVSVSGGTPVATDTIYYVKTIPSTTSVTLSTTSGGTTVDITATGTALATQPMSAYLDGVRVYQWRREVSIPRQNMYAVLQCEGWITAEEGNVAPPLDSSALIEVPWVYINTLGP